MKANMKQTMGRQAVLVIFGLVFAHAVAYAQTPKYLENLERLINKAHAPQEQTDEETENLEFVDASVKRAVDCVDRAFTRGAARELGDCLTRKPRVYLSVEAGGKKADNYGTSQLKFILDQIFREVQTQSFRHDTSDIERFNDMAMLTAEWTYVILDKDEEVTEYLQFTLEKDESVWRVFEISSVSR
jgi:hypothetical protein